MRICITGGPRTGKTTLALKLVDGHVAATWPIVKPIASRHTDDLMHLGWSEASAAVLPWLDEPGPWIIEGVAVSRALRKWREAHPGEAPPVDRVIYLCLPREQLTSGQEIMTRGIATVHDEIEGWLAEHGIETEYQ